MLLLKVLALMVGLGIAMVAVGLVLYDACLEANFQRHATRRRTERSPSPPPFCRPAVFLYQRGLAERATRPAEVRVLRIRRRVRALRRTTS